MLGHGFDKTRARGVVAELFAYRFDALGQCFVGDGDAAPDLFEKAIFRHEFALFAHEQRECIEIAGVQFYRHVIAPKLPISGVKVEIFELKAAGKHFSAEPQNLLMPLTSAAS